MFHRTDVLICAWKPYIIWFYVRSIQPCIIISIRDFILVFFKLCWYEKDIFLLIFIIQNCQNVHWNHRKTSVFKIYLQLSFTSRWIMTFTDRLLTILLLYYICMNKENILTKMCKFNKIINHKGTLMET